ncbi:VWA domain-containing protein [Cyanobacterium stanieri LEGE 03274]|uniref:VWA domain-containing protein n=1 Tax=Cyanobacterium stanieri LEGE 03274 TaxID=1828756 RepID=A0ABR9V638_9CHRO|nr:VWA domain-containing protein [Cyanobacterium stanieri]MBE9223355.1 VWA domain-containing protein [Cyanobacterium stanieri LEGE 03274]
MNIFTLFLICAFGFYFTVMRNINAEDNIILRQPPLEEINPKISQNIIDNKPKIQIAILLDSSNSMDGLIEQTRTQIWSVINAVSKVTKNGEIPAFEVSLYHYGNNSLPSTEGFNRMLNQLTTDLDIVSENLFSIQTNGGQEYAGWVINSAVNELNWSNDNGNFRAIFIAGNEPFNQGNILWERAINLASSKDIIINTIYCGEAENAESNLWARGADLGKGSYFNINQNQRIVDIPTPYDESIKELNQDLNDTYIPYGEQGIVSYERQRQQDINAFSSPTPTAGLNRAITKTTPNYNTDSWDLVEAIASNTVTLNDIDKQTLPENLRSLTTNELQNIVNEMIEKREKIKQEITELSQKRRQFIDDNKPILDNNLTLENLMIDTLYNQLKAKGFSIN